VVFDDTGANAGPIVLSTDIRPAELTVDAAKDYIFQGAGAIVGSTGLTKAGTGTLTLVTDNSFTGMVKIQSGAVQVGTGGTSGVLGGIGDIEISNGASLLFNRSDDVAPGRAFIGDGTGAGTVGIDGGGSLTTIGGNETDFVVDSGTLYARGGGAWSPGSTITVNNGGTLDTVANSMGGSADIPAQLDIAAGGKWVVNNEQSIPTVTNLVGGSIEGPGEIRGGGTVSHTGDATSTVSANVALNGTMTFDVADGTQADDMVVSGDVAGNGTLLKDGAGTLALTGTVNSGSGLGANAGTLALRMAAPLDVGSALSGTGGTIVNESGAEMTLSGDGTNYAGVIDANGKDVVLGGATSGSGTDGTLVLGGATLKLALENTSAQGKLYFASLGGNINTDPLPDGSQVTTTASVIQGGIANNTTLALAGYIWLTAGDWSFAESVDDKAYVKIDGQTVINNGKWNQKSYGTFNSPADGWYSFDMRVSNGGGGNGPSQGASFSIGIAKGASTNWGDFVAFEIGVLGTNTSLEPSINSFAMAGGLTTGGGADNTVDVGTKVLVINGPVEGPDPLVKQGSGTLTLNGAGTITGAVTVKQGALVLGPSASIASASLVQANSGSSLGGEGQAGPVTIKSDGFLIPGGEGAVGTMGIGAFHIEPLGQFKVEVDSNSGTADKVVVGGDVTLDLGAMLVLADLGSTAMAPGASLTILDYSGHSLTGEFIGRAEGASITVGVNAFVLSYVGNGGTAVTLSIPGGSDYDTWAGSFGLSGADADPGADPDSDGVINDREYAFGLDPTSAASVNSVTSPLSAVGEFSYTRRDPALTGLAYTIETSTDMATWTPDAGATQTVAGTVGDVQTVDVTVTAAPAGGKLFVRAVAD